MASAKDPRIIEVVSTSSQEVVKGRYLVWRGEDDDPQTANFDGHEWSLTANSFIISEPFLIAAVPTAGQLSEYFSVPWSASCASSGVLVAVMEVLFRILA